jgi:hypothetical protein
MWEGAYPLTCGQIRGDLDYEHPMKDYFELRKRWCLDLDIRGNVRDRPIGDIAKQSA